MVTSSDLDPQCMRAQALSTDLPTDLSAHALNAATTVINTRPAGRAAPLTHVLRQSGYQVVEMPMLDLQPQAVTAQDVALMRQWMAGEYHALVVVSPMAASLGLAAWQTLMAETNPAPAQITSTHSPISRTIDSPSAQDDKAVASVNTAVLTQRDRHDVVSSQRHFVTEVDKADEANEGLRAPSVIIAVGDATAAILSQHPALKDTVRQPATANNEGMLAMAEIDNLLAKDKLLVWRGNNGRRLLVDTLSARGVHIDSIAWYTRRMPEDAASHYQRWWIEHRASATASTPAPIVIISSGVAFSHWMGVVEQGQGAQSDVSPASAQSSAASATVWPRPHEFRYVVLGERLATMLAAKQLCYWRVEDLAPKTILATINTHCCADRAMYP